MKSFMEQETRFRMIQKQHPERFKKLLDRAQKQAHEHYSLYTQLAEVVPQQAGGEFADTSD